jgi:hypothetical protein
MSRWGEMFAALSHQPDTVDTVDAVQSQSIIPLTVSHSVHCVTRAGREIEANAPDNAKQPEARIDAPGEPVLLRDGRRLHRFRATEAASCADIDNLLDRARWRGAVLVADGRALIVVEPWSSALNPEILRELRDNAGAIVSVLIGESRERLDPTRTRFVKGVTG